MKENTSEEDTYSNRQLYPSFIPALGERAVQDNGRASDPITVAFRDARPRVRPELRDRLITIGQDWDEARIIASSPIPIPDAEGVQCHVALLLQYLYHPNEFLFIGSERDTKVSHVGEWFDRWQNGDPLGPYIIPNPLTGELGPTKGGKSSFRADACVAHFRYCMAEFDSLDRQQQLAFWAAIDLPIVALIDSGGKSIHAWIRVDCVDREAWDRDVEIGLYAERLIPMGVDRMCRTEARLSRLPGFLRPETNRWQRLLYLAPTGRRVNHE